MYNPFSGRREAGAAPSADYSERYTWRYQASYLWDGQARRWVKVLEIGPERGCPEYRGDPYWDTNPFEGAPYAQTDVWGWGPEVGWERTEYRRNWA